MMEEVAETENCKLDQEKPKGRKRKTPGRPFTRRWCSVPLCKSRNYRSLHRFPRDPEFRKKWVIACRIGKKVTENMQVCRDHFLLSDFIPRWDGTVKRLKSIAIPSQNLPTRPLDKKMTAAEIKRKEARALRAAKRLDREDPRPIVERINQKHKENKSPKNVSMTYHGNDSDDSYEQKISIIIRDDEIGAEQNGMDETNSNESSFVNAVCECDDANEKDRKDEECFEVRAAKILVELNRKVDKLVKCKDLVFAIKDIILKRAEEFYLAARRSHKINFISLLKNDHQLNAYTGIDSNLLKILTESVKACDDDNFSKYELSIKESIVLSLIKLRLDLSFLCLANLFHLSERDCIELFRSTIATLKTILKSAICWPTKDEIMRSMPESLATLKKTVVVMDCNDIKVDIATCSKCQLPIKLEYNGSEQLKFLLGFANCGLITYVGKAQQGICASQETITDQNYISKVLIPSRDAIMTDGCFIEEDWNRLFIELIKARKQKPFEPDALRKDRLVATDIENAYSRFKKFQVLQTTMSCDLATMIDDISVVICGIVNLSNSVIVKSFHNFSITLPDKVSVVEKTHNN